MKTVLWLSGCVALAVTVFSARADFSLDASRAYSLPKGERIKNLAVGDIDGDGLQDIVAVTLHPDVNATWSIYLLRQGLSGRLSRPIRVASPDPAEELTALRLADLDHDGRDEIVVSGHDGVFSVSFAGGALPTTRRLTAASAHEIDLADFDGDGNIDLVAFEAVAANVVYLGDGKGSFDRTQSFGELTSIPRVAVADLDHDGRMDYVVATDRAYVYFNRGIAQGLFGAPTVIDPQFGAWQIGGVATGDFSGDGLDDLVLGRVANSPTWIAIYQQSKGALIAGDIRPSYDSPADSEAVDLDGDGRSDLIVAHRGWASLGIYVQGSSGLQPERLYPFPGANGRTRVEAADMNSDGCLDVVANSMDSIFVFRGSGCASPGDLSVAGSLSADSARIQFENVASNVSITDVVANISLQAKQGVLVLQTLPDGCIAVGTNSTRANVVKVQCRVPELGALATTGWSLDYSLSSTEDARRVMMTVQGRTATAERVLGNNVLFRTWASRHASPQTTYQPCARGSVGKTLSSRALCDRDAR